MPLRLKCKHCAKELVLDDAFRGAACRCQHCRGFFRVPAQPAAARASARPDRPPLERERQATRAAVPPGGRKSAAVLSGGRRRLLRSPVALASLGVTASALASLALWSFSGTPRDHVADLVPGAGAVALTGGNPAGTSASQDEPFTLPADDPRTAYFGVPLEGGAIAYVVDNDKAMAPYVDGLSRVTSLVTQAISPGRRRYGIVPPSPVRRKALFEAAERTAVLEGADAVLSTRLSPERIDLPRALARATDWVPDQVFLVVGRKLDAEDIDVLTQAAEQTGAVTNLIAVGPAAAQDLSPIASATGGQFIPLADDAFRQHVARYEQAAGR
jgi:hypothetical protein